MPPDNVTVRSASVADAALLASLSEEMHNMHYEAHPEIFNPYDAEALKGSYQQLLEEETALFWIAEVEGTPAGFVSMARKVQDPNVFLKSREWCEVNSLGVISPFRSQGIGRLLLETAMNTARAEGLGPVELTTWWFNEEARAIYEHMGFAPKIVRFAYEGGM